MRVVVSGLPGVGKTTLARALAAELGVALLSKDILKESLADTLGFGDQAWSQRLGGAGFELLWVLIPDVPHFVVETAWGDRGARRLRSLVGSDVLEVFCRCDPLVRLERNRRRVDDGRHPIHREVIDPSSLVRDQAAFLAQPTEPVGLGGPLLELDTTVPPDPAAVAAWVRNHPTV